MIWRRAAAGTSKTSRQRGKLEEVSGANLTYLWLCSRSHVSRNTVAPVSKWNKEPAASTPSPHTHTRPAPSRITHTRQYTLHTPDKSQASFPLSCASRPARHSRAPDVHLRWATPPPPERHQSNHAPTRVHVQLHAHPLAPSALRQRPTARPPSHHLTTAASPHASISWKRSLVAFLSARARRVFW